MATKTTTTKDNNPLVSIIIPTHKKYPHYKKDILVLKKMIHEAEMMMNKKFGKSITGKIITSLNKMKSSIDFSHLNEGLVLHCSENNKKIIQLPFHPEEKLIIDNSYEIRDVLYSLKNAEDYLILVLSEHKVRVIRNNRGNTEEIKMDDMPLGKNDTGGRGHSRAQKYSSGASGKHVSDHKEYDEHKIAKYLADVDKVISAQEELKNIPLVICAPVRLSGHFKAITKNKKRIYGYLKGNFEKDTVKNIVTASQQILNEYHDKKQKDILLLIEKESKRKRIASGLEDVYRCAKEKQGHLLVLEKDFVAPSKKGSRKNAKTAAGPSDDLADDIIEKVLEFGGDIEFVDNGMLKDYDRIVLIKRF